MTLNQKDPYDKIIIDELLHENYDVYAVNEIMYLKNYKQLGTFVEPTVFWLSILNSFLFTGKIGAINKKIRAKSNLFIYLAFFYVELNAQGFHS